MDNNFDENFLYNHNAQGYNKVKMAYDNGEDIVGIVHATGTGKTHIALQLCYDNKDKKILYLVPALGIVHHVQKIIDENSHLDLEKDFENLSFKTYQCLVGLTDEEIAKIECDLLILDEFHHIGAPKWGLKIKKLIETHPNMKIFGMTAYTIRDRGTPYERDMANPKTNEIFSNKIRSRYDLCDAMIDKVLPKPIYKSSHFNLMGIASKLEKKVLKLNCTKKEYQEYMNILTNVKKRLHEAGNIGSILKKNIKPQGKYIYFCPPRIEDNVNDIETIKKQAYKWFKEITSEDNIVFYTTTSEMEEEGEKNREAFYDDKSLDGEDVSNKLRVMFAINQYNEGIHAPNIDGVIMGRGTSSDIVFFEQLGRALAVRGNTQEMIKKLENYEFEELKIMAKQRDISFKNNISKEELIQKLVAPIVIDFADNYDFIKELEEKLKNKVKELQIKESNSFQSSQIIDVSFDIEMENQDLYEMLKSLNDKLIITWDDWYNMAKNYYEYYKDLLVPDSFKTYDGINFIDTGYNLGNWIRTERKEFITMSDDRKQKLEQIGFIANISDNRWEMMYSLAQKYYETYGNLEIPQHFKTTDGINYDENGLYKLGSWLSNQRLQFTKLLPIRKQKLEQIGFVVNTLDYKWEKMYKLAQKYYEINGNLLVPDYFKTNDGYTYDENGKIKLGLWIETQRKNFLTMSDERKRKLEQIGFVAKVHENNWDKMYNLAKNYYEYYGDLDVAQKFKTSDGITYDEQGYNLGSWIGNVRQIYATINQKRKESLQQIGFIVNALDDKWDKMYKLAKNYYEYYGNLNISKRLKTSDGITYDEQGYNLGTWLIYQRQNFDELLPIRKQKLKEIGFVVNTLDDKWDKMYNLAKNYYEYYGNLNISKKFKTSDGITYDEQGYNLGFWIVQERQYYATMNQKRKQRLQEIGFIVNTLDEKWEKMYKLAQKYYEYYGDLNISKKFKTSDGINCDENGYNLGQWIIRQRSSYDKLLPERKEKLEQIGFVRNALAYNWQKNYELVKKYFDYYHNINVPKNFKTKDGITSDEEGINIYSWLLSQRAAALKNRLTEEQLILLTKIGLIWDVKKNREEINNICIEYNIDKKKNEIIINHISTQELKGLINFLICNNLPLQDENGILNPIFNMSNEERKEVYGIDFEDLINSISRTRK